MRTLLLDPLYPFKAIWGSLSALHGIIPPLGLVSVYTYLKHKGYDAVFLDPRVHGMDEKKLETYLLNNRYDVIGIPVHTCTKDYSYHTARICKKILPSAKIVFGNVHASCFPQETMKECKECDFIVRNEGELTMADLLSAIKDEGGLSGIPGLVWRDGERCMVNPPRPFIDCLDSLPPGLFSDIDLKPYIPHMTQALTLPMYPFIMQRGCFYSCVFCSVPAILGKKVRRYSPERVAEELRIFIEDKGARGITFHDSTFTIDRQYTMQVMQKIIDARFNLVWTCTTRADKVDPELLAKMKKAGCRQIGFGIESANQQSLDMLGKRITVEQNTRGVRWVHKAGIKVINSFMLCLPGETEGMVRNTVRYAKSLCAQVALFWLPVPFPETEFYRMCKESGEVRMDAASGDYLGFGYDNPVYVNAVFGKKRMLYWYKKAFFEYYSFPPVWWQNLKALRNRHDMARIAGGIKAVFLLLHSLKRKVYSGIALFVIFAIAAYLLIFAVPHDAFSGINI